MALIQTTFEVKIAFQGTFLLLSVLRITDDPRVFRMYSFSWGWMRGCFSGESNTFKLNFRALATVFIDTYEEEPENVPNNAHDSARVKSPLPRGSLDNETENWVSDGDADRAAEISRDEFTSFVWGYPLASEMMHGCGF
jgi:hypothetical protein